jgi:predicted transcriptional regulator
VTLLPDKDNTAKHLYEVSRLSIEKIASLAGVGYTTYYRWLLGRSPNATNSARIRELLREFQEKKETPIE